MTIWTFLNTLSMVFDRLVECSWRAGLVILVVLAIRAALGRRLTGRWLHALWLIAMLRLALPWVPETSWNPLPGGADIHWMIATQAPATPVPQAERLTELHSPDQGLNFLPTDGATAPTKALTASQAPAVAKPVWTLRQVICLIWMAGIIILGGFICLNVAMLRRGVVGERLLTDTSVLNLLEDCKRQMGITVPIGVVVTDKTGSPALFGFIRPRLLIPCGVLESLHREELRHVFLHELAHIKRNDVLVGWAMCVLQVLHWFNPLVWLAQSRMRADRELACDALVLRSLGSEEPRAYGTTIVHLLERFSQPRYLPALTGILEDKSQLRRRITMIAKFRPQSRLAAALALVLSATVALLALTTAPGMAVADNEKSNASAPADKARDSKSPRVVSIEPKTGATDVNPNLRVIRVVFDRPMRNGSWSVVGGGPNFPEVNGKPSYDATLKVFTLPVALKPAWSYEFRLNSKSHKNFVSRDGVPLEPVHVTFKTGDGTKKTNATTQAGEEISPSELLEGSKIDERGHIVDRINWPFVDDPAAIGKWESVDFVRSIDQFKPGKQSWKGDLFLKEMVFKAGGKLGQRGAGTWTKGLVLDKQDKTASKYEIKDIQGVKYMFYEWKSGDYTIRHRRPSYYVLRKLPADGAKGSHYAAEKAAIESAQSWLNLVDAGNYAKSWQEAASYFKTAVTQEDLEKSLRAARSPLGKTISRKVKSQQYAKTLPGAPDGEYVVIQYQTKFENKADAIETVTPMLGKDGKWRVSGYYIK